MSTPYLDRLSPSVVLFLIATHGMTGQQHAPCLHAGGVDLICAIAIFGPILGDEVVHRHVDLEKYVIQQLGRNSCLYLLPLLRDQHESAKS